MYGELTLCDGLQSQIQARYTTHRETRAGQQRERLLSPDFGGVTIDTILHQLENDPGFVDPRHCLVFWARPPDKVKELIEQVQSRLKTMAPSKYPPMSNTL